MAITPKEFEDKRVEIGKKLVSTRKWVFGKTTLQMNWVGKGTNPFLPRDNP